jgi:Cu+-exporting ATPase
MERDVVCGMEVDRDSAAAQSEFNGRTYFFCSQSCKENFDRQPERYIKSGVA